MYEELERVIAATGISIGEVLAIAREIAEDERLRTTDLLTKAERALLVAEIEKLYCVSAQ